MCTLPWSIVQSRGLLIVQDVRGRTINADPLDSRPLLLVDQRLARLVAAGKHSGAD